LEEGARIVTFANGFVARELIVDIDDENRRLAYAVSGTIRDMMEHEAVAMRQTLGAADK
jgi:hypothetical protein